MKARSAILITGASGFLGSHLAHRLLAEGCLVLAYKRKYTDLWRLQGVSDSIRWYEASDLDAPFKDFKVEHVIHTATCYGTHNEDVSEVVFSNLLFPLKLFEKAAQYNVSTFFNTDTYLNVEGFFYDYLAHYVLSKKQFSDWLRHLASCGEVLPKIFNLRLEHVYGPCDKQEKFVYQIINQCLNNVKEIKLTEGKQKRDFIYVDDVVAAYICLLNQYQNISKPFNFFAIGTGVATTVREFVKIVAQITGSRTKMLFGILPYRKNEIMESTAKESLPAEFGWKPKFSIEMGIKSIIEKT